MIVVRANLYTERAERIRKNRPKLISALTLGLLVCARLVSDYGEKESADALRRQLQSLQQMHGSVIEDLQRAHVADRELTQATVRRDAVFAIAGQRRNWAPILGRAFAATPASAEFIALHVNAARPEDPIIRITGRCSSAEPRLDADKCMLQMTHAFAVAGVPFSGRILSLEDLPPALVSDVRNQRVVEFVLAFAKDPAAHAN